MKILHISYSDNYGGANIAAKRIYDSIKKFNTNTEFLVIDKKSKDKKIINYKYNLVYSKKLRPYFEKIILKTFNVTGKASLNLLPSQINKFINKNNYDVVNLHWINNEMMSINDIDAINSKIYWTVHDFWPLSDIYHYPFYTKKNFFEKYLSKSLTKFKLNKIKKKKIKFIFPSKWIYNQLNQSFDLSKEKTEIIRNPIDTNFWSPNKKQNNQNIILFGAVDIHKDNRKGFKKFVNSINKIYKDLKGYKIYFFGTNENFKTVLNIPSKNFGYLQNLQLRNLYRKSSGYVVYSEKDNLPNTAIEALSCGVPLITVKNNGLTEIIKHKSNGYILKNFSPEELKKGLIWISKNKKKKIFQLKIRNLIKKNFSYSVISKKYLKFYKN